MLGAAWETLKARARALVEHPIHVIKNIFGHREGLTAGAHKLGRIIYGMIFNQTEYDEETAFKTTPSSLVRQRQNLEKQAAALGLQLTPLR